MGRQEKARNEALHSPAHCAVVVAVSRYPFPLIRRHNSLRKAAFLLLPTILQWTTFSSARCVVFAEASRRENLAMYLACDPFSPTPTGNDLNQPEPRSELGNRVDK